MEDFLQTPKWVTTPQLFPLVCLLLSMWRVLYPTIYHYLQTLKNRQITYQYHLVLQLQIHEL